ncbi:hypothetical protein [uncultured Propionibacterium sp.]|uniref:hypothetical protein n=1 Tax=uncultured Propionibacterium sp. TaxID=218066 RepID=UPI00292E67D8|nr:hypothetical protein [uncultured Propionibacterium sp.]
MARNPVKRQHDGHDGGAFRGEGLPALLLLAIVGVLSAAVRGSNRSRRARG